MLAKFLGNQEIILVSVVDAISDTLKIMVAKGQKVSR
jgi:hypothetical protein